MLQSVLLRPAAIPAAWRKEIKKGTAAWPVAPGTLADYRCGMRIVLVCVAVITSNAGWTALVLFPTAAIGGTLSHHQLGGPDSLRYEIVGLRSDMTSNALDTEALRVCPQGYQSESGEGFTKPDGSKWWRFRFVCWDVTQTQKSNVK